MLEKEVSPELVENLYQSQIEAIAAFRSQQVNAIFIACATFGVPSLIASIYRAKQFGVKPLFLVQLVVYFAVLVIIALRHRLSFRVRTFTLLTILFILGVGGLFTWGLMGMGIPFIISSSVITTVLFGSRAGIIITALGIITVALAGIGVYTDKLTFGFDMNVYARSAGAWFTAIFSTGLFTTVVVISSGRLYNSLMTSIRALSKRTATLQQTNEELQREISKRKEIEEELRNYETQLEEMVDQRTKELQSALANVKMLTGMLPICASCKNIRDDEGYWHQVEVYIRSHSEVEFSHGICPDCTIKLYPELILKR
jgi:hypothetical protein